MAKLVTTDTAFQSSHLCSCVTAALLSFFMVIKSFVCKIIRVYNLIGRKKNWLTSKRYLTAENGGWKRLDSDCKEVKDLKRSGRGK